MIRVNFIRAHILLACLSLPLCFVSGYAEAPGFTGLWTLTIDTPRGVRNPTLEVVQTDGVYSGTYNSVRGPIAIEQITIEGENFEFPLVITVPIGEISVVYRGKFRGNELTGLVANPRGEVAFSGIR